MILYIGIPTNKVEQLLLLQYLDAKQSGDYKYLRRMRQALCEWVGEEKWRIAKLKFTMAVAG